MRKEKNYELSVIALIFAVLFALFLAVPLVILFAKSVQSGNSGITWEHYSAMFHAGGLGRAFLNSVLVSLASACITTVLAFIMAYSIHYTNLNERYKKFIRVFTVLPMLLPTITYGFAIIYTFGKQGLVTKLFGRQLFNIYGVNGLLIGYVIYTLPTSFMLIHNTMGYVDKKFSVVSRIMGDKPFTTLIKTVIQPLSGTIAASLIQCFFLSFTDFGIPASVGGSVDMIATVLYNQMLGSVPDFNKGAVIAILMLLPSIISVLLIRFVDKYNIRYTKVSEVEMKKSTARDTVFGVASGLIMLSITVIFLSIVIVPFVKGWPYDMHFTLEHVQSVFCDSSNNTLIHVYFNSVFAAILTAVLGTVVAFGAALITARSTLPEGVKAAVESVASVTNTIPGMVLGIAYMLAFSGTSIQNTMIIIVISNMIHYFATPYTMLKNTLMKMNLSWERTARLMGDNWIKTLVRVVIPNAKNTLLEVFQYYIVNAMVTVSAVVFIAGAKTMVITAKIKELQHFAKFNEIFILSLLIFFTNLLVKVIVHFIMRFNEQAQEGKRTTGKKRVLIAVAAGLILLAGCGFIFRSGSESPVYIYTNADDEAVEAMQHALDNHGYKGRYVLKSLGTSELGGKLLAEGKNIEADLVTMSSFYLDTAQEQHQMFADLEFDTGALSEYPSYYTPITALEGTIIYNTKEIEENNLPLPASIADLADPVYKGYISITDIQSSSTGWLLVQALINEYGEKKAAKYLRGIYENAGAHLETSGSGPIKKVRSGEVAIGFGLRHQAVADKASGLPIDYIDPTEGNFSLTESVAVVNKQSDKQALAMEMAECIVKDARAEILKTYPIPLYEGETVSEENTAGNPKVFKEKLTVDLLKKHQEISEKSKKKAEKEK